MSLQIAISIGDAAGVGPELAVRTAEKFSDGKHVRFILHGPADVIEEARVKFAPQAQFEIADVGALYSYQKKCVSAQCGLAAWRSVRSATESVIAGHADAIVTAPVNKYAVNLAGIAFSGHTEMIAELCNCKRFAMMQSSGELRVAFVTTHIALGEVPRMATFERIVEVGRLLGEVMALEHALSRKIAVMAINPHAGENGCMGREDEMVVKPAVACLRAEGWDVTDPLPPDTLFVPGHYEQFGGILSMYHDQGHIPFKMLAFDTGVNSTIGLPIIRTSPDHGTAFDAAWTGRVDPGSMFAAAELAIRRAEGRRSK
ncbi:MAG: 4-hydroxythreonine-4-phosphate dehydrogenase PdxA [Victivallaceae bacterium]|nr:4-hydroxythreonine-4-phosphate dehydrogenase PdxA [Victivallaceae bacterium]